MNKQKQKGSIEIISITVVVLLIIAGVGYVAWNAYAKRSDNQTPVQSHETNRDVAKREFKTVQIADTFPVKLTTRYPADWALTVEGSGPKESDDSAVQQKISLSSPSKKYTVSYMVISRGGLGGTCIPEMSGDIKSITRDPVAGFDDALFVEATTHGRSPDGRDSFGYTSGLYADSDEIKDVKEGDSLCKLGLINSIKLSDTLDTGIVNANITINNLNEGQSSVGMTTVSDISLITNSFETAEYKDAVQILKSMKLTK